MLKVSGVAMEFPGVKALKGVTLEIGQGEVHGLIGENGAGKSTLLKILSGVQQPTEGQIELDGSGVHIGSVRQAENLGIAMIHQELNLVDTLTAEDNLVLGSEPSRMGIRDRAETRRKAAESLQRVGAEFGPEALVSDLSLAQKQRLEIAKAVQRGARVVIMDEPTAVLSGRDTEDLLALVGELSAAGTAIIYVSHRLDEVVQVCTRITVLRDGEVVSVLANDLANPVSTGQLAALMVGRELQDIFMPKAVPEEEAVLRAENLLVEGLSEPCSLHVKRGEVVGIAGLVGSGRTELAEGLAGLRPAKGEVDGVARQYVSEDRKGTGLFLDLDAVFNTTASSLSKYRGLTVNKKAMEASAKAWADRLATKIASFEAPLSNLSGGNQQKVALAKALDCEPQLLILDEPTRGVDVGAKAEIYALIAKMASEGVSFLVISSELPEIIGLCSRAYVMRDRKIVGEVSGDDVEEHAIMRLAAGVGA